MNVSVMLCLAKGGVCSASVYRIKNNNTKQKKNEVLTLKLEENLFGSFLRLSAPIRAAEANERKREEAKKKKKIKKIKKRKDSSHNRG